MNSMKRMGLKLFSLCVLALGLVAFSATAAQAEGTWMVKGVNLTTAAQNKTLVGTLDENHGILLAKLGLNEVAFLCTAAELLNAILEPGGAISEKDKNAKADFGGCTTTVNGQPSPACLPVDGPVTNVILTQEWYGLLTLHTLEKVTKDGVIVLTPKVGSLLLLIQMGEACAIGEDVSVFGSLALHDVGVELNKDECQVERANHLVAEFKPLTDLKVANATSSGTGILDGMAGIKLTTGEIWSCLP